MSIDKAVKRSFEKKYAGGWKKYPRMYWAIDLHGVILKSTYKKNFGAQELNEDCLDVLKWLTDKENMVPILFTASNNEYIDKVLLWLNTIGIKFEHVNSNPEVTSNNFCIVEGKFYFDILIDDKGGFEMDSDWLSVKNALIELDEW
jgi:hypothetical protein